MSQRSKALREQRAALVAEARALVPTAPDGKLTAEQEARFDTIMKDVDALKLSIDREERLETEERELDSARERRAGLESPARKMSADEQRDREQRKTEAYGRFLRHGAGSLSDEDRALIGNPVNDQFQEQRDLSAGTTTAGGFTVPQGFAGQVEVGMKAYSGVLQAASELNTDTGAPIPWPTMSDVGNVGEQIAENAATATQDLVFGSVTLNAWIYSSKYVPVSIALLQDNGVNLENEILIPALSERIGRILNQKFTTGAGTTEPKGVVTAAALGKTGLTGQTTSVIYDDLIDLQHSVDPAYRSGKQCGYMMKDLSIAIVRKLKDTQGRPLWEPSLQSGMPDSLCGFPVFTNQDMATMAANAKSILFGDFSRYKVRRVKGMAMFRLVERAAEKFQVWFIGMQRYDGNLIDPGTNPLKYYANSAT